MPLPTGSFGMLLYRRAPVVLGILLGMLAPAGAGESRTIAVTTIIEHPALDAARRGLQAGLREHGLRPGRGVELVFRSAGGSRAQATTIAEDFVAMKADVIVPISTPSAQATAMATTSIPIVFAAVTDPLAAALVEDVQAPGGNVTGVSDQLPVADHLDLILEVAPGLSRLGVVADPDEARARSLLGALRAAAAPRGIEIVTRPARDRAEVRAAAEGLSGEVDALYLSSDDTVASALEEIVAVGEAHDLPVFASDVHGVPRGALAGLGFNYFEIGRQAALLVKRVLDGEAPGSIPIQTVKATELYVNPAAAGRMGVDLPEAVVKRAAATFESR
ncbi:MAG TPA: ABC transporter substrate-binding protein [Geminicoccaceae bacterium]